MKPRNREINIFNLSMMDVISGAMGAFLVLVVLLSRHYDPDPPTTEKIYQLQKELVEATGQIDDASRQIHASSRDSEDIVTALLQARGNVDAARAAVAGLRDDVARANARIRLLEEEAEEMQKELARRLPFLFEAIWQCAEETDVDLYLHSSLNSVDGKPMPDYTPSREQNVFFSNTEYIDAHDLIVGADLWLYSTTTPGNEIKVYYRLAGSNRPECVVRGYVAGTTFKMMRLPPVTLNAQDPWMLFGTLRVSDESELQFTPASQDEREKERRRLGAGN